MSRRTLRKKNQDEDGVSQDEDPVPLDCGTSGYKREIPDPDTWRYLQDTYLDNVKNQFTDRYKERNEEMPSYSGFRVAVEVKDTGLETGRGVFALEPILKGTKIWDSAHLVSFHYPHEMRSFLKKLDHKSRCDALLWAYPEKDAEYVSLALDPASFVNHGESAEDVNLDQLLYTTRDIEVGEELFHNYTDFMDFESESTQWFNQIRGKAWKQDKSPFWTNSTTDYNVLGGPVIEVGYLGEGIDESEVRQLFILVFGIAVLALRRMVPSNLAKKTKVVITQVDEDERNPDSPTSSVASCTVRRRERHE
jgi:hypothetical protein